MLVRTLGVFGLALGLVTSLSSSAHAINEYHLLALQLEQNFQAETYNYRTTTENGAASRSALQNLRIGIAGSQRSTSSRLITAPRAATIVRTGIRYAPNPGRVGGLGREISGNAPSISLHSVESGGSSSNAPSFGNLHEGGESFSFSKP